MVHYLLIGWAFFTSLVQNKAHLAKLLSNQIIKQTCSNKTLIVAIGYSDETPVES